MNGFVDIHAHVLPGIDDGPADMEGALALARAARDSGTTTIVATPHLRADFPAVHVAELAERGRGVGDAIDGDGIGVRLVVGAEVSLLWALDAQPEDLMLATYGQRGKDLLIEAPSGVISGFDQMLYQLRVSGFRVTLAHPERTREFQRNPAGLAELVHQGILVQINAENLLGPRRGSPAQRTARQLCRDRLAHVIASDGHRADTWRPVTSLAAAVSAAAKIVGHEEATWMARAAPAAIIAGEELPERPLGQARGAFKRLFSRG